jgi:tRNA(Ile)-lysidine synthase
MAPAKPESQVSTGHLLSQLLRCPELLGAEQILVAYSGGLDSTVLLHLLHLLQKRRLLHGSVAAIHIHHGLQQQADDWLDHCAAFAESLELPLLARKVKVAGQGTGQGLEAAARTARYAVFTELLAPSGVLLQAHHLDDQTETVLLHLLRGSGPRGLAGIPARRALGQGSILRPLLNCSRSQLLEHAEAHGLCWVEDPSNSDSRFDRNFLRHQVLPLLNAHWPGMAENIERSAQLCGEADELLRARAKDDLLAVQGKLPYQLDLQVLAQLAPARIRNLLRFWVGELCQALGGSDIPYQALQHTVTDLIPAMNDATPVIRWGRGNKALELRRFENRLYLLKPLPQLKTEVLRWDTNSVLQLPGMLGTLSLVPAPAEACNFPVLEVRFRQGGESIRLDKRPHKTLKNLLQENAVPPWVRACLPLVFHEGELIAVAHIFYSAVWSRVIGQNGAHIVWKKPDFI